MIKELIQINKFENYLLIFTIVDILFAPYVFLFATTYSQLIVFLWFLLKDKQFFNHREVNFYYAVMGFILLSVFVSLVVLPSDKMAYYAIENFKRGLNIGLAISYYFFFYYIFKTVKVSIEKWMIAFIYAVTIWGVIYYLNLSAFLGLKVLFNPRDATLTNLVTENFFLRYNYIWTDPNNVGYTLVAVVSFLILNKRVSNIQLFIIVPCLLFCLLIIMSAGSIVSAIIFIPIAYIYRLTKTRKLISHLIIIVSFLIFGLTIQKNYSNFSENEIGKTAISRLESKSETGDTRPEIWLKLLKSKNILLYLFAGEGTVLFVDGKHYSPHSGHFVFIFGYGIIAYLFYLYIVFRKTKWQKWKDYIYILPLFICFTINIGIGELKFAAIMYMIIAYSRTYLMYNYVNPDYLKKQ